VRDQDPEPDTGVVGRRLRGMRAAIHALDCRRDRREIATASQLAAQRSAAQAIKVRIPMTAHLRRAVVIAQISPPGWIVGFVHFARGIWPWICDETKLDMGLQEACQAAAADCYATRRPCNPYPCSPPCNVIPSSNVKPGARGVNRTPKVVIMNRCQCSRDEIAMC